MGLPSRDTLISSHGTCSVLLFYFRCFHICSLIERDGCECCEEGFGLCNSLGEGMRACCLGFLCAASTTIDSYTPCSDSLTSTPIGDSRERSLRLSCLRLVPMYVHVPLWQYLVVYCALCICGVCLSTRDLMYAPVESRPMCSE